MLGLVLCINLFHEKVFRGVTSLLRIGLSVLCVLMY